MSPFMFLLVVEGLSRMVLTCKRDGRIKGINMGNSVSLTHLLFVDDLTLFSVGSVRETV